MFNKHIFYRSSWLLYVKNQKGSQISQSFFSRATIILDYKKGISADLLKALNYGHFVGEKQKEQNGYIYILPKEWLEIRNQ